MKKYKIKKPILYIGLLALSGSGVFGIYSLNSNKEGLEQEKYSENIKYEPSEPVVKSQTFVGKPFINEEVNILKNYYEVDNAEEIQENSIIYYDSTYMQNSSIAYGGPEKFDIVSILDGKVVDIRKDELIGNIIEIEHESGITSIYQSVNDIKVEKGSKVSQGEIIAISGQSVVNKDLNSHLLFEIIIDKEIVNPENYYGKDISKINK